MSHLMRIFVTFTAIAVLISTATPSPIASSSPVIPAAPLQTRLVVFEAFMRQGCGLSQAAGVVIDGLAPEYAGQPVVFLEYNVDSTDAQFVARRQRWWDAYQIGGSVSLPLTMVDSGHEFSNGVVGADVYRSMVNNALVRPPQAEIEAYWWRVGDSVTFAIQVTNLSGVTLSSTNKATVWGIVYEDEHVVNTDHYVRAVTSMAISNLTSGASATFTLQTADLTGVDWAKLHFVALVDYRPNPSLTPYNTLQAVFAQPQFTVQPDTATLMADPGDATTPTVAVSLLASETMSWTAETSAAWLTVTPTSGNTEIQPVISVMTSTLTAGWQQGIITFTTTSGDLFSDTLAVSAYYGPVWRVYLPCVIR